MKYRTSAIPFLIIASALTCNAYATPGRAVRKPSTKSNVNINQQKEPWNLIKRSVSTGVYDVEANYRYDSFGKANEAATMKEKKINPALVVATAGAAFMAISLVKSIGFGFLANPLGSYKASMAKFPLYTKIATGATLAVLGDGLAQVRDADMTYSPRRAFSFAAFDSCYRFFQHNAFPAIIAVCQGRLIGGLLSALPGITVGANLRLGLAALERTLLYQLAVIPLLYYPIFFSFTGYLQGLKPQEILSRAKANFLPCWKKNLMFWIPAQMVMFGLIPEQWQIPFACVMGMIWSTILSVVAGDAKS